MRPLYLGLDSSTQSVTAIVIEVDGGEARVVFESSLAFDEALPQYGTHHGVLPSDDPAIAVSSPLLWADALDLILARVVAKDLDVSRLAAIAGSAQQHGSVYLKAGAATALGAMDPSRSPADQVAPLLSRSVAPIWMDSSTTQQCLDISMAIGGPAQMAAHTGSRAFERFTAAQIRKFANEDGDAYLRTGRIHLVSSFLASLLIGGDAPIDPGDASGMNLMDLTSRSWWNDAVNATAPALLPKLPTIAPSWTMAGTLSPYWQVRHHLPAAAVITWSGDNPCSMVGVGLVREGRVAISLGTSDTIFGAMAEPRVNPDGIGHVFGSPTGDYMGLTCFSNGSLARERIRDEFGMTWKDFSAAVEATPPGNDGRILIPWFVPEITPAVARPAVHRYRLAEGDAQGHVRGVVEAQQMAMLLHSRWMGVEVEEILATGGAAVNTQILQVMADVFGAEVSRSVVTNSAALGAALRAWHAHALATDAPLSWDTIVSGLQQSPAERISPDAAHHERYRQLLPLYQQCEQHALGQSEDPSAALAAFRSA
jgi:xylulokinase